MKINLYVIFKHFYNIISYRAPFLQRFLGFARYFTFAGIGHSNFHFTGHISYQNIAL